MLAQIDHVFCEPPFFLLVGGVGSPLKTPEESGLSGKDLSDASSETCLQSLTREDAVRDVSQKI